MGTAGLTFDTLLRWGSSAIKVFALVALVIDYRWRTRERAPEPVEHVREGEA